MPLNEVPNGSKGRLPPQMPAAQFDARTWRLIEAPINANPEAGLITGTRERSEITTGRREFLLNAGLAVATATALAIGLAGVDPGEAWALAPTELDEETARGLLRMARTLYPHAMLSDVYYAKVVEALDAGAVADPTFAATLRNGVTQLASPYGVPFDRLSPGNQLKAVTAAQGSPFFEAVRSTTVSTLYANPQIWPLFGYEGPSVEHGGYLYRGFDDIAWLPRD
jgi:hypothetical protein